MPWRAALRARWRTVGLLLVLLAGTVLVTLTWDRGHDPRWTVETGPVAGVTVGPAGDATLVLVQHTSHQRVLALHRDGTARWNATLPGNVSDWAVGSGWVALASPGVNGTVTVRDLQDGRVLADLDTGGPPRALAAQGPRLAVAVQSQGNPVSLVRDLATVATHPMRGLVMDVALGGDVVAAGSASGELLVARGDEVLLRRTLEMEVAHVALSHTGDRLLAAGTRGEGGGLAHFYDLHAPAPDLPQWSLGGAGSLGSLAAAELSADGRRAVLLEESGDRYRVHAISTAEGRILARATAPGIVSVAPTARGLALAPGGDVLALASVQGGDLLLLDVPTLTPRWSYRSAGATSLAFAPDAPKVLVGDPRTLPDEPFTTVARFHVDDEPANLDVAYVLPLLLGAEVVGGALLLARGLRRPPSGR